MNSVLVVNQNVTSEYTLLWNWKSQRKNKNGDVIFAMDQGNSMQYWKTLSFLKVDSSLNCKKIIKPEKNDVVKNWHYLRIRINAGLFFEQENNKDIHVHQ